MTSERMRRGRVGGGRRATRWGEVNRHRNYNDKFMFSQHVARALCMLFFSLVRLLLSLFECVREFVCLRVCVCVKGKQGRPQGAAIDAGNLSRTGRRHGDMRGRAGEEVRLSLSCIERGGGGYTSTQNAKGNASWYECSWQ